MSATIAASNIQRLTLTPPSTPPTPEPDFLSDVFSDTPGPSPSSAVNDAHPSDIPRLRSIHATAGYRDGISEGKSQSLQSGFDEGYSIGASFGLRIGHLLGAAEALLVALRKRLPQLQDHAYRLEKSLQEMTKELSLENIFDQKWWDEDGSLKGDCSPQHLEDQGAGASTQRLYDMHPLLTKWSLVLKEERRCLHLREGRFQGPEWESGRLEA